MLFAHVLVHELLRLVVLDGGDVRLVLLDQQVELNLLFIQNLLIVANNPFELSNLILQQPGINIEPVDFLFPTVNNAIKELLGHVLILDLVGELK